MWTLQELYFSKNVVVRIGDLTVPWERFYNAAEVFGLVCCRKISHGAVGSFRHARLLETTQVVQSLRDRKEPWSTSTSASRLLLACRQQSASEFRDKVYALYSILKDSWARSDAPLPDYNLGIPDVYRWATILALRSADVPWDSILLGVCNCERKIQDLPSWSPDYSHSHPLPKVEDIFGFPHRSSLHRPSFSDAGHILHLQVAYLTSVVTTAHWQPVPTNTSDETWLAIIQQEFQDVPIDRRTFWRGISSPGSLSAQHFWVVDFARKSRFFKHWFDATAEAVGEDALLGTLRALLELQLSMTEFTFRQWACIFLGKPLPPSRTNRIVQADISRACISWETEVETLRSLARLSKLASRATPNPGFLAYEMVYNIHEAIISCFSDFTVLVLQSGTLALGYPGVQRDDQIGLATVPIIYRPSGDYFRMISPAFMATHDAENMINQSMEAGRELMFA